jgi:hypothetical protein
MTNDEIRMTNVPAAEDPRWLDRLVDGELDANEQRQLLLQLENQPDGWRRCALAFLEAQAWRRSLGALTARPAKEPAPQPAAVIRWWSTRWGTVLAAAASFLIAFGLGQAWRTQATRPAVDNVAANAAAEPSRSATPRDLSGPEWSTMVVNVDNNADGVPEQVELPVVRGPGIDEAWVRSLPPALSSQLLRAMERAGHQVQQQRRYYPIELEGGQRIVVPVDELDVRYVGDRQFQ